MHAGRLPGYYVHMPTNIAWADCVDEPWIAMEAIRIGDVPAGLGSPEQYVLVSRNGQPLLRIDAYRNSEELFTFKAAIVWQVFLVVGWGNRVYLIHAESFAVIEHSLAAYFGGLYPSGDGLLVASGERVHRIAADGSILWQSACLGIDGVIVHDIKDGIISGSGEWDPPGGWQPFQIRWDSGRSPEEPEGG